MEIDDTSGSQFEVLIVIEVKCPLLLLCLLTPSYRSDPSSKERLSYLEIEGKETGTVDRRRWW